MHRKQSAINRQHLEAIQAQMERTKLLGSPLSQPGAALLSSPPLLLSGITLHKMTSADDPQTFLEMFEATAVVCSWPAAAWAMRLLLLVSGEAQTVALSLPSSTRGRFQDVKKAIQPDGYSPEDSGWDLPTVPLSTSSS